MPDATSDAPPAPDKTRALLHTLIRFAGMSALSFAVNFGLTIGLTEYAGFAAGTSFAVALVVVLAMNFLLGRHVVFRDARGGGAGGAWRQLGRFAAVSAGFRLGEWLAFMLFQSGLGFDYRGVAFVVLAVSAASKFVVYRYVVFTPAGAARRGPSGSNVTPAAARPALAALADVLGWACVAAAFAVDFVRYALPPLRSLDRFDGDAVQHVWWTAVFADPGLFRNDLVFDYFSSGSIMPPGHRLIFQLFVPIFGAETGPQRVSELLTIPILALTLSAAFLLGRACAGWGGGGSNRRLLGGLLAVLFVLAASFDENVVGGFARSWAPPLLLWGMWALVTRSQVWLGVILLACVLLYPPIVVVLGATAAVTLGVRLAVERRLPRRWPWLAVLGGLAFALLLRFASMKLPEGMGPQTSGELARTMPEFGPGGRQQFFVPGLRDFWFYGKRSGLSLGVTAAAALFVIAGLGLALGRRRVPTGAWCLLGVSLTLFAAAHAVLFRLYLPSRYALYSLPVAGLMLGCALVPPAAAWLARRRETGPFGPPLRRLLTPTAAAAAFAVALLPLAARAVAAARAPSPLAWNLSNIDGAQAAWSYLETLPKDALVAAHPRDADYVPLRARRSVLIGRDTSLSYHIGYYLQVAERLRATFNALYADDWATIDALHDRFGVDVLYVNDLRYTDLISIKYHEPFTGQIAGLRAGLAAAGSAPVLLDPPPDRVLFRKGHIILVRVGPATPPAVGGP